MSTTARKRNRQGKSAASKRSKSGKTIIDEDVIMAPGEEVLDPTVALIDLQRLLPVMEGESTTLPPHELRSRATYCRRLYDAAAQPDAGAFSARVDAACARAEQMAQEKEAKMAASGKVPSNLIQDIFHSKPSPASDASPEEKLTTTTAATSKAPASPTTSSKAPVVSPPPNVAALQQNQREQMEVAVSQMATQMKEQTAALHATLQSQNTHLLDAVQDVTEENVRDVSDVAAATQQHVRQGWRRTAATWGLLFTVALATVGTLLTIQMVPKSQRQHQVLTATLAELPCLFWCDDEKQDTPQPHEETIEDVPDLVDESDEEDVPDLDDEPPDEELSRVEEEEEIVPEAVQDDDVEDSFSQEGDVRTHAVDEVEREYQEEFETVEEVEPQHEEQVVEQQVQREMESEQEQEPVIPKAGATYRLMTRSASHGRLDLVHKQLSRNPMYVHTQDDNGWALIHEAARAGYLELIEMLVEFGANLWLETSTGETPMDLARMGLEDPQHPAIVYLESLMYPSDDQDEEPEYSQEDEAEEQDPEEMEEEPTEEHSEPDSVEIDPSGNIQVPIMDADAMREAALREFEDMQSQASSSTGGTTHQAAGAGAAANANTGGDPFSSEAKVVAPGDIHVYDGKPFSGRELRRVASRGDSRRIAGMLEQNPEFIDQPDQNGWTALHLAVRAGHTEVVQHLLQAGADVTLITQQGRSVMDMAMLKFGSEPHPIIDMLEEYE